MLMEKPEIKLVAIELGGVMLTTGSNCIDDAHSSQGGGDCIGNNPHAQGEGCYDTAPLIQG